MQLKLMKFVTAAFLGLAAANESDFMAYITRYGKSYATIEEFNFRKALYETNMAKINDHNANNENDHVKGENFMTDWTEMEFKRLLGLKPHNLGRSNRVIEATDVSKLEDSMDWRDRGAVTEVKN